MMGRRVDDKPHEYILIYAQYACRVGQTAQLCTVSAYTILAHQLRHRI